MEGELIPAPKGGWSRRNREAHIQPQPPNGMTITASNRSRKMELRNSARETTGIDPSGRRYDIADVKIHGTGEVHRVRIYKLTP